MDESSNTRDQLLQAIDQLVNSGGNISISAVAAICGVSHSLIYNRYPDLKERIKELKRAQKDRQKTATDQQLIDNLLAKNKVLLKKLEAQDTRHEEREFSQLLAHLQQVYSMYDQLLEDRNRLVERLSKP
jgi:AcrR family transcriptional regulator